VGGSAPPTVPGDLPSLHDEVEPISPHPIAFPLLVDAQRAGSLAGAAGVEEWRAHGVEGSPARDVIGPPPPSARGAIEEVILRRGSTRIMRPETAPAALLQWGMAYAGRPVPADFVTPGATLLEHNLSVHGIEGVDPGAYRWRDGDLERVRPGQFREI